MSHSLKMKQLNDGIIYGFSPKWHDAEQDIFATGFDRNANRIRTGSLELRSSALSFSAITEQSAIEGINSGLVWQINR